MAANKELLLDYFQTLSRDGRQKCFMKGIGALFSFTYALEADHIYQLFLCHFSVPFPLIKHSHWIHVATDEGTFTKNIISDILGKQHVRCSINYKYIKNKQVYINKLK